MSTAEDLKELSRVYEDYVLVFGQEAQFKMVLEEALEFAHAALKVDRELRKAKGAAGVLHLPYAPSHPAWNGAKMGQLLREALDCLVMIGQLPWITGKPEFTHNLMKKGHKRLVAKMKERLKQEAGGE